MAGRRAKGRGSRGGRPPGLPPGTRFDWDRHWASRWEAVDRELVGGGLRTARRVVRFLAAKGLEPRRVADVGCGPAVTLFELARRLPAVQFRGFDASPAVLRANRRRASARGLENLRFLRLRLPDRPKGRFDLLFCFATLHYVENPERALRALWACVNEGGFLVFNYPNRATRAWYARAAEADPEVEPRFSTLLEGRSVLTRRRAERTLGCGGEDFWAAVGEDTPPNNPCLAVRKGPRATAR